MSKMGRPMKFESVEILQEKIDKFFMDCDNTDTPYTITGLALALDTDRQTLINYEGREEFFDTIKKAKLKVENQYEQRLIKQGRSGDIFALKNFGWTDKQEIDQTIGNKDGESLRLDLTTLSTSEIEKILNDNKE